MENIKLRMPENYVILDIETTGLSVYNEEIIEIAAIKVKNNEIIEKFSTLIKPNKKISEKITEITKITNNMVENSPKINNILSGFMDFIKGQVIIAHNAKFDLSFLYKYSNLCNIPFEPFYIDSVDLFKKCTNLYDCSLETLAKHYQIQENQEHRALRDCILLFNCIQKLEILSEKYTPDFDFKKIRVKTKDVISDCNTATNTILSGKYCVITGEFKNFNRAELFKEVTKYGGICQDGITKQTNYLFCGSEVGQTKLNKAKEKIAKGQDLQIILEDEFYKLIEECKVNE